MASENGATFQIIQRRALQDLVFGIYGEVSAQVRKVCSIQNLIDSRYVAQHAEHRIACSKRRVPISPAEHVSSGASLLAACDEPHLIDDRETRGKVGNRASCVGEDAPHIWRADKSVHLVHLSDSAIGVCRQVKQIVRRSQRVGNSVR